MKIERDFDSRCSAAIAVASASDLALRIVDDLEKTEHLTRLAVLACDSMEDLSTRNAFVALLDDISQRIASSSQRVRALHVAIPIANDRTPAAD